MDSRLPRYQQLRDDLTRRIAALEWSLNDPLPTEQELAQTYDVAIGTVRKAIDVLEQEGRVERFQGRGTFIRRATFDQSLFRFFRFNAKAHPGALPQSRILNREIGRPPLAAALALGLSEQADGIHLQRLRLIDSQPLVFENIWLPLAPFTALADLPLDAFGDLLYPLYEKRCGQVVAYAKERLTVSTARAEDVEALQLDTPAPIVVVERTAFGHDGRPLEWRISRGNASHFAYEMEIR